MCISHLLQIIRCHGEVDSSSPQATLYVHLSFQDIPHTAWGQCGSIEHVCVCVMCLRYCHCVAHSMIYNMRGGRKTAPYCLFGTALYHHYRQTHVAAPQQRPRTAK